MDMSTMIESRSCDESFSRYVQMKLEYLDIIYSATEEFKSMLSKDVFIKAKPNVVFLSMHYLINIFDPAEFKKRFYWPITDKKSEASFRASLMQYFNSLKEKHDLQWLEVRSYLFIKPCGHKLMTFLNDFIDFIINERITRLKKTLDETLDEENKMFISKRVKDHELYKSAAFRHLRKIDTATLDISEKTNQIILAIEKIASVSRLNPQKFLDTHLMSKFRHSNESSLQHAFQFKVKPAQKLEICIKHFKIEMNVFLRRKIAICYNKEFLLNSCNEILGKFSNTQQLQLFSKNSLNLIAMFQVLNIIVNSIKIKYSALELPQLEEMASLKHEILRLEKDLSKTEYLLDKEEQLLFPQTPLYSSRSKYSIKFVCTPPVNFQPLVAVPVEPRLVLLNDFNKSKSLIFGGHNSRIMDNVSKLESSYSTKIKSSIIKSRDLLRTATKRICHIKDDMGNISNLAVNWKERYSNLLSETTKREDTNTSSSNVIPKDNVSSLLYKEIEIARLKPATQHLSSSFEAVDVNRDHPSPSGRLNPLVTNCS